MLSPRRKLPRARSVASRDRGVTVGTSGYELGASPRLGARRRSALAVLQEQPETVARVSIINQLMERMDTVEAPEAARAQIAAPPAEESAWKTALRWCE